ncbi:MAG: DUF4249 family protein [Bacteroidia bacterium]
MKRTTFNTYPKSFPKGRTCWMRSLPFGKGWGWVYCLLLLSSCTSVIQVSVPGGTTNLVIDAFLDNSAKAQKVRITTSANYFSNVPTPAVLGATVSLTDLTNTKTYTFTPDGSGNYIYTPIATDTMGLLKHKYQLNISYNGNTYFALSTMFQTMPVDTILFRSTRTDIDNKTPNDTTNPRSYYPLIIAQDIRGQVNYYWIKAYKNGVFYNKPDNMDFFQDGGYAGTDGNFIRPPYNFFGVIDNSKPYHRGDTCTIEIYSTDANTNDFLGQLQTQMTNAQSGLFAVTPQNVKTNVQQTSGTMPAIGWFNMAAVLSKSVVAK